MDQSIVDQFNEIVSNEPELFKGLNDLFEVHPTPYGWSPPKEWMFEDSTLLPGQSTKIYPDGRFSAWSHSWDQYHLGLLAKGEVWKARPSKLGNKGFHQGSVTAADGTEIPAGSIPIYMGHPDDPYLTPSQTAKHYNNSETVRVVARANETEHGVQVNGFIIPGTTKDEVAKMKLLGLSGDWRHFPEVNDLDYVGPCFVPRPAMPRTQFKAVVASLMTSESVNLGGKPIYTAKYSDEGRLMAVTASMMETPMTETPQMQTLLSDPNMPISSPEAFKAEHAAVTASDEALQAETRNQVSDLTSRVEQLEELVFAIVAANDTVETIDSVTPDS